MIAAQQKPQHKPQPPKKEPVPPNAWPLNQEAKRRLVQAGESPDPSGLYLVQLLNLGFEKDLPVLGQGGSYRPELESAAQQLYDPDLKPAQVMRWLLSNRNAGDQQEQTATLMHDLESARSWKVAAQNLMQWFYDLKASQDPYYRPAQKL